MSDNGTVLLQRHYFEMQIEVVLMIAKMVPEEEELQSSGKNVVQSIIYVINYQELVYDEVYYLNINLFVDTKQPPKFNLFESHRQGKI